MAPWDRHNCNLQTMHQYQSPYARFSSSQQGFAPTQQPVSTQQLPPPQQLAPTQQPYGPSPAVGGQGQFSPDPSTATSSARGVRLDPATAQVQDPGIGMAGQSNPQPGLLQPEATQFTPGQSSTAAAGVVQPGHGQQTMSGGQGQPLEWGASMGTPGALQLGAVQGPQLSTPQAEWSEFPLTDVFEGADEFVVLVNLPGFDTEEIELDATNRSLRIIAHREEEEEIDEDAYALQRERRNRAERVIELPGDVDIDDAEATCVEGVCRITLPKTSESKSHRIGVH